MAITILTEDFISICLLLADGDTTTSLENVIRAAESYQQRTNRYFGTSESDFGAIIRVGLIALTLGIWEIAVDQDKVLRGIKLCEVIPEILKFHETWSNDEGDYLVGKDLKCTTDDYETLRIKWDYGYSKEEYSQRLKMKEAMKEFFSKPDSYQPEKVMGFLAKHNIDDTLLVRYSK